MDFRNTYPNLAMEAKKKVLICMVVIPFMVTIQRCHVDLGDTKLEIDSNLQQCPSRYSVSYSCDFNM